MVSETQFLVAIYAMEAIIILFIIRYFYVKQNRKKMKKNEVDDEIEKELRNKNLKK
ncbi:hypothetical protein U8527_09805 [Kordia algicida OT-1]|uniref:Uncharacterized protein n=1 Tax=Kordia algicida OT-1 TaxID=391587 RepID=A9DVA2_9FLAO|nr:hypothetical protein [Kordia algicida]EDP96394.1 hypothetical protein KAOT1_03257 [Kordia algicida OT-1]